MNKAQICPVCHGKGTMPKRFYEGDDSWRPSDCGGERVTCRTCRGEGIVWPPRSRWTGYKPPELMEWIGHEKPIVIYAPGPAAPLRAPYYGEPNTTAKNGWA